MNDNFPLGRLPTAAKPQVIGLRPNRNTGCSHPSRDANGLCRDCWTSTGVPGVEFQTVTLRERAQLQFRLAKRCFARQHNEFRRGSKVWRAVHRQQRQWAAPLLESWAALRRMERTGSRAAE
jgi:hypothetical protein